MAPDHRLYVKVYRHECNWAYIFLFNFRAWAFDHGGWVRRLEGGLKRLSELSEISDSLRGISPESHVHLKPTESLLIHPPAIYVNYHKTEL